jgi:uncharacterized protein (DUF2267 family)
MQYDQFVGQVQHRARLASSGEAVRAIRATLETLGERLFGGEAENLASQLPMEIGRFLLERRQSERFDLNEFFRRVAIREGVDYPEAVFHARAVLDVLDEAVSPGLIQKVCAQLPDDYDRLFEIGGETTAP